MPSNADKATVANSVAEERQAVFEAFRRWGYLDADLDPLGYWRPAPSEELKELSGEAAEQARRIYCGTIGVEFWHIPDKRRREWIQERMEGEAPPLTEAERTRILEQLIQADCFEEVLHARYKGTKRFSLEGITALLPLLEEIIETAAERGAEQVQLAMSHRGRLNVMAHVVGRPVTDIFAGFEDVDPRSVLGSGDVKYHLGATGVFKTARGREVRIHLVSNPSHLEAVVPVTLGRVRAKQARRGENGAKLVLPVLLHGDAAIAGQGITAESFNLHGLRGFDVGGAVHVVVNNLIGFTTTPAELYAGRFATDVAKRLPIPIFHVNAEDPDAVVRVARLAAEYRYEFSSDVVIDLVGYRRFGHSEIDDASITQPVLYRRIESHPPLWLTYGRKLGVDPAPKHRELRAAYEAAQEKAEGLAKNPMFYTLPDYWAHYFGGAYDETSEVDTGVEADELAAVADALTSTPPGFHVHPKVQRLLEQRAEMGRGQRPVDFGMAEALAFGTLLREGVPVRLSGQDSRRGTFNQRHAVLFDTETEAEYIPLAQLGTRFEVYNSILSEAAVLGFEYGYSRDYPDALVLWEAQFGDFANNAQVIIDQFLTAGEDKWGLLSGLVLLLPHGFEGQGPEHSSARIERFLQLAAEDNIQICQPSTAAQYFHLLRRQARRRWRKPLVVFTPKSMLRHPDASSPIEEFSRPRFWNVMPDRDTHEAQRVLLCTGKIAHELRRERARRKDRTTAIVSVEQLYPFPAEELTAEFEYHDGAREFVWVQEEPANMGALAYLLPRLEHLSRGRPVRSVKRSASASPATGSAKAHEMEQRTLLTLAFATGQSETVEQAPAPPVNPE
ncbi:MAG TPA: 2-oxoglutarate dehydrogenase E1 component [Candidatus Xenobia bacterium]|nr:2-oxoglutarate dehydrogenase E1 component [Candidatus Xenobia bacterium]